jgi:tRNA pseudouridine38-40 synthase
MGEDGDLVLIRIRGSHFIWKMVRQIVGVLAEVGRGKMPLNDVKTFLHTKSDEPAKLTAPPSGLFLERVYYRGDFWLKEIKPMLEISTRFSKKYDEPQKESKEGKSGEERGKK